jgi:phenylpyruvate tautomerase PptA (4-oxalocrotonate tautomerase family)
MPLIMVEAGEMPEDMRIKLMKKLTEVSAEIIGIPEDSIYVFVKQMPIYVNR